MIVWILLLLILWIGLYYLFTYNFNYWKKRNVPFAKPTWLFGNVFPILIGKYRASEYISQLHNSTEQPYLGLFVFNKPYLIIRDLEIIKHILIKDFDNFMNRTLQTSKYDRIGSNLLVMLRGKNWKTARRNVSPIFTPSKLKAMFPLIQEVTDNLISHIEKMGTDEFQDSYRMGVKFGVDITSSCMFGIKACALENTYSEFFEMTLQFFEVNFYRAIQSISCFFVPHFVDFFNMSFLNKSSMEFMEKVFINMLRERKVSCDKRNDIIDILNKTADGYYDEEKLSTIALSLLAAGYETTGSTLSFLIYELSRNHDIQKHLRNEVQTILKEQNEYSYQAIMDVKYLDMVIKETLRMYPVIGFLDRICDETYKVPQTDLVIEKGIGIYVSTKAFHFDKRYFPNPEIFDPERFSAGNEALIPECVYTPFGKGLRGCPGTTFAMLVLKAAVAKIIMKFQIDSCNNSSELEFDGKSILLAPKNAQLHVKFKPI